MKQIEILRNKDSILLQSESDAQYLVKKEKVEQGKMDKKVKDVIYPEEITGTLGRLLDEVNMPMDIQKEVEELYNKACKLLEE